MHKNNHQKYIILGKKLYTDVFCDTNEIKWNETGWNQN